MMWFCRIRSPAKHDTIRYGCFGLLLLIKKYWKISLQVSDICGFPEEPNRFFNVDVSHLMLLLKKSVTG